MTSVLLTKNGKSYEVSARGHATGSEAMCSAISTLIGSLSNYLRCADYAFEEKMDAGDACIRFKSNGNDDAANGVFEFLCAGFLALQATDKTKISVKMKIF